MDIISTGRLGTAVRAAGMVAVRVAGMAAARVAGMVAVRGEMGIREEVADRRKGDRPAADRAAGVVRHEAVVAAAVKTPGEGAGGEIVK